MYSCCNRVAHPGVLLQKQLLSGAHDPALCLEGLEPFDEGYLTRQGQPAALRAPTAGLIAAASSAAADTSDGGPLSAGLVGAIAVLGLILFTMLLVGALLVLRGYWRHRRIAGGRIGRIGLERKRGGGRGG